MTLDDLWESRGRLNDGVRTPISKSCDLLNFLL
jgi:hypothetical protein